MFQRKHLVSWIDDEVKETWFLENADKLLK